jgi:hypothetical protein
MATRRRGRADTVTIIDFHRGGVRVGAAGAGPVSGLALGSDLQLISWSSMEPDPEIPESRPAPPRFGRENSRDFPDLCFWAG